MQVCACLTLLTGAFRPMLKVPWAVEHELDRKKSFHCTIQARMIHGRSSDLPRCAKWIPCASCERRTGGSWWNPLDHPANRVVFGSSDAEAEVPLPSAHYFKLAMNSTRLRRS